MKFDRKEEFHLATCDEALKAKLEEAGAKVTIIALAIIVTLGSEPVYKTSECECLSARRGREPRK